MLSVNRSRGWSRDFPPRLMMLEIHRSLPFAVLVSAMVLGPLAAAPLFQFEGDGLTIRVLAVSGDETKVTGELDRGGVAHPFTGAISSDGEVETVTGTYRDGDKSIGFTSRQTEDEETLVFKSGGKIYRLREVEPVDRPAPAQAKPVPRPAAGEEQSIKLSKAEFRDINMNNVVAYTMLVPAGWDAQGHIEWSNDRTPYPQRKISVTAPDQSRISFIPALTFHYSEATALALRESAAMGIRSPIPERQGDPPPQDIGKWLIDAITKNDRQVTRLKLVSSRRDHAAEEAMAAERRAIGQPVTGTWQTHLVTIAFELGGVPFTQEFNLTHVVNPAVRTRNIDMWSWMVFMNSDVRAPSAVFPRLKPLLYASAHSLRSVPRWWTQQQLLIMEITRRNHVIGMEEIRRRGEFYDKLSDANFAEWKKKEAASDSAQNDRINTIYETGDFRDTDGLGVKLPIHYQNYYSDGKGNYLMNNSTLNEPGSGWTRLESVK